MKRSGVFVACCIAALVAVSPTKAGADEFPSRPVKLISQFSPGSVLDNVLRLLADRFQALEGQPIIIENRPGGSGLIAAHVAATAPPDGYTILMGGSGMMTINPYTFSKLPYDPTGSFRPLTNMVGTALVFAAGRDQPFQDLPGFIAWAKAHPGKSDFASYTAGTPSHFAGFILNRRAGIDMLHVPYNGASPAVTGLIGGQIQTAFLQLLSMKGQVDAGLIRPLATTGEKRSPLLPNVPTFAELGYPDLIIYAWVGLYAPAGTPDAIVARLSADFNKILRAPDVAERLRAMDFEPLPGSPAELAAFMKKDGARWQEAVRMSGFKANE